MSSNNDKAPFSADDKKTDRNGLPLSKDQLSSSFEQPLFTDKPVFRSVSVATQPPTLSRFGGCSTSTSSPAVFESPFLAKPAPVASSAASTSRSSSGVPSYAELPKMTKLWADTMHPANFCFVESVDMSSITTSLQRTLLRRSITFNQKMTDSCFRLKCSYHGADDVSPCTFYVNMFSSSGSKQGVIVEVIRWEGSALSFESVKSALLESAQVDEVGQNSSVSVEPSRPPLSASSSSPLASLDLKDIASVLQKSSKLDDVDFALSALSKTSTSPELAKVMFGESDITLALSTHWSKSGSGVSALKDEDVKHIFSRFDDLCMATLRNVTSCLSPSELSEQMASNPGFFSSLFERCMHELTQATTSPDRAYLSTCILDKMVEANSSYGKKAIQNGAMESLVKAKAYGLKSHYKLGDKAVQAIANLECLA